MDPGPPADLIPPPITSGQLMSSAMDVDDQGSPGPSEIHSGLPVDHASAAHEENTESYLQPQQPAPEAAQSFVQAPVCSTFFSRTLCSLRRLFTSAPPTKTKHVANVTSSPADTTALDKDATERDGKQEAADSTVQESDVTPVNTEAAILPTPLASPDGPSLAVVYDADWVRTTFRVDPKTIRYPLSPQLETRTLAPPGDEIRGDEPWLHELFALTPSPSPEPEITSAYFTPIFDEPMVEEHSPAILASNRTLESLVESGCSTLTSSELPTTGDREPDVENPPEQDTPCASPNTSLACQLITPLEAIVDDEDRKCVQVFDKILVEVFKYPRPEYRPLQQAAMLCATHGKNVVVFLPTGAGKSLCFQVPALRPYDSKPFPPLTVVVCPTTALISDQLSKLWSRQILAVRIDTSYPPGSKERRKAIGQLKTARLLYITPEGIGRMYDVQSALSELYENGCLERFVIDEAHCIEECGSMFRDDYRKLGRNIRTFWPDVPVTLLSATFTTRSLQTALNSFGIKNAYQVRSGLNRKNLHWEVRHKDAEYLQDLASFIAGHTAEGRACGIVYERTKAECVRLAAGLRRYGISAYVYHATLGEDKKNSVQRNWERGRIDVIVATIAFGQGIDKADVRFVIHTTLPETMAALYQESGRAGRDGKDSTCLLYFNHDDFARMSRHGNNPGNQNRQTDLEQVKDYACDKSTCRRVLILKHFGEEFDSAQCAGTCDNCKAPVNDLDEATDATWHAIELLTLLDEISKSEKKGSTIKQLTATYAGMNRNRPEQHRGLATAGKGKALAPAYIEAVIEELLVQGALKYKAVTEEKKFNRYLKAGSEAANIMNGSRRIFVARSIPEDRKTESRKRKAEDPVAGPTSKRPRVNPAQVGEESEKDSDSQSNFSEMDRDSRSRASGKRKAQEPAPGERRSQRLRTKAAQVVENVEEDSDDQSKFSQVDRSRDKGKRKADEPAAGERSFKRSRVPAAKDVVGSEEDGEESNDIELIERRALIRKWRKILG